MKIASGKDARAEKRLFVGQVTLDLLTALRALGTEIDKKNEEEGESDDDTDTPSGSLLDLLFEKGLLPSYAFPTDLCSFVIQERGEHGRIREKERPQLAKNQALSEYAPGRLLVVNKETYRVD